MKKMYSLLSRIHLQSGLFSLLDRAPEQLLLFLVWLLPTPIYSVLDKGRVRVKVILIDHILK